MNDHTPSDAWQAFRRVYWTLAAAIAALLVLLVLMGFGPGGRNCAPAKSAAADGAPAVALHESGGKALCGWRVG